MLKNKITKEEVNALPVVIFEGKITLVDDLSKVHSAIQELRKNAIVGIDTETKPSFTRGTHHKVSLVQISSLDHCFLFRLNLIDFPAALAEFLSDKDVLKIGLSLRDDLIGLNKRHTFKPAGFIDIQTIAKNYGIMELSLQKIYAILFGSKISKSQRLTNWENAELSEQQLRYAATDAWASLQIYLQLLNEKKLSKKEIDALVQEGIRQQQAISQRPEMPEIEKPNQTISY
ncbi:MAG: 3'-5' exonuclease [Paludibacter sp.]